MSKIKLLLDVVQDIRSLADSLQSMAEAIMQNEPEKEKEVSSGTPEPKAEKKNGGKKAAEKKPEAPAAKVVPEHSEPPLTLEQVRAVLAEKSRAGYTAEVRALLNKHGADKLSNIDPAEYPALLADAEVL